ncbi:MAG TPA: amidase [Vicinamibacterales bacterium]|nr:amidase [Vicinamibacterales bacterium]
MIDEFGFAIGTETSGSILSPSARCGLAGLRPTFGRVSRYGVMALSWTQDRLGPICRYAEDCAIVMQAIARPDGRDMSVSDVPFNWDPALDVKTLKVGIIEESFSSITNKDAKANADKMLDTLKTLGVANLTPVKVPDFTTNVAALGVESAAFFDHLQRAGKMEGARGVARSSAWLTPAVEFLQAQRVRMMMMMKLAEATSAVDVYIVGANNTGGTPTPARGRGTEDGGGRGADGRGGRGGRGGGGGDFGNQNPTQRHFTMANLACYPAVNIPNGFAENGQPTNAVFYGRPFKEMEILALAKAYQDAAGFHLKQPMRLRTRTSA